MDFTLQKYQELCKVILEEEYTPLTVESYLRELPSGKVAILRHDVDRVPERALKMAKLEKDLGIVSTYYFRMNKKVFKPEIIKEIASMGHEIGYHYEVLDKAKGSYEEAIKIFEEELNKFREICDVYTVCMHGNPLTPWINKDLWKRYDLKTFGIIGEPYISIDYRKVCYFSDTGRTWSGKFSVKDSVEDSKIHVKTTNDIIELLRKGKFKQVCILTHPNRWCDNPWDWFKELITQNIKNIGKRLIIYGKRRSLF